MKGEDGDVTALIDDKAMSSVVASYLHPLDSILELKHLPLPGCRTDCRLASSGNEWVIVPYGQEAFLKDRLKRFPEKRQRFSKEP